MELVGVGSAVLDEDGANPLYLYFTAALEHVVQRPGRRRAGASS
jgi:hypothetical protein